MTKRNISFFLTFFIVYLTLAVTMDATDDLCDTCDRDALTITQQNEISKAISETLLCVGKLINPSLLLEKYESSGFVPGINYLCKRYKHMRMIRGDGNCFYRSFLFAYLESLFMMKEEERHEICGSETTAADGELQRIIKVVTDSKDDLIGLGYAEMIFESFYDMLLELLTKLFSLTRDQLYQEFQDDGNSDYYIWYIRLLTSCSMKQNPDRFLAFIDDVDITSYCNREVEPMGKECEAPQILALVEYFNIQVQIEYLDGRDFDEDKGLSLVKFPDNDQDLSVVSKSSPIVYLLYRPGHYDILYK